MTNPKHKSSDLVEELREASNWRAQKQRGGAVNYDSNAPFRAADRIEALEAENERLRGYAVHLPYCQSRIKGLHENPCTCGLSALIKEIEGD